MYAGYEDLATAVQSAPPPPPSFPCDAGAPWFVWSLPPGRANKLQGRLGLALVVPLKLSLNVSTAEEGTAMHMQTCRHSSTPA